MKSECQDRVGDASSTRRGRAKLRTNALVAAAVAAAALTVGAAHRLDAASSTWTGGGADTLWSTAANWTAGAIPGSGDTATFAGTPTSYVVSIDAGRTVRSIFFDPAVDAATPNFFKVGDVRNGGPALTLEHGGAIEMSSFVPTVDNTLPIETDVNAPLILAGTSYSFINNSGDASVTTGGLRFIGNITSAAGAPTTLTLDGDHGQQGSSRAEVYGRISDGPNGAVVSVVKNGTGAWEMNASGGDSANDYSGDTIINAGVLRSSSNTDDPTLGNGLGGFSKNSHYIVKSGATIRNSIAGNAIRRLTLEFGSILATQSVTGSTLNIGSNSGPALLMDYDTPTNQTLIRLRIPLNLTGTVADEGGITLLSATGAGGTGLVEIGDPGSPFDMGAVRRVFDIGKGDDANGEYDLRLRGVISGSGGMLKKGAGSLRFDNINTFTGQVEIQEGTFILNQSNGLANLPSMLVNGGTFHLKGGQVQTLGAVTVRKGTISGSNNLTVINAPSYTFDGAAGDTALVDVALSDSGAGPASALVKTGAGNATITLSPAYTGATTVNAGTLAVAANFTSSSAVHVTGGTLRLSASTTDANRVMRADTLSISGDGRIDLTRNKLLTNVAPGTFNGTAYTGVQGEVQRAYNFGAWDQPGLTTSEDRAGQNAGILSGTETIAVATAEQVLFIGPTDTALFAGQTVTGATTIAMYTYAGDLNFDGLVDGADYGVIDNSVQFPGTDGYVNGDFNYDGVIDGADYGIIDNTVQLQGAPFSGVVFGAAAAAASSSGAGISGGVTAVPEPSACGFALFAAAALLKRRRRT